jgi:hypothetical protein
MTPTALIAPPASGDARNVDAGDLQAGLPPLLSLVPVAGPDLFAYAAFGVVLLLLLVPPFTLLATLALVAFVAAAALAALVALAAAILEAAFLFVRFLRDHRPGRISLPVPHIGHVKVRRV